VSAGWLAGCLVQAAFVIPLALHGRGRLHPDSLTPPGQSLAFYGHVVLLPSLGWHTSWWLRSFAGANGAAAIAAVVLAVSFGLILVTQPGARLFVVTAVAVGFIFTVISVSINRGPALNPMLPTQVLGTRYTIMADFLIVSALIVGADHALRSRAHDRRRQGAGLKSVTAVTALVVFLGGHMGGGLPVHGPAHHDCMELGADSGQVGTRLRALPDRGDHRDGLYQALDAPLPEYHP
jgi:hypothetical protein